MPAVSAGWSGADTTTVRDRGRIVGTVSAEGRPVPFAQVVVRGLAVRAVSGEDGRFVLIGLNPGQHTVLGSAFGFGTTEVTVSVAPGASSGVDLVLEPAAIDLNPMVVTATRKRTFVSESPVKVDVVPARFLQAMAATSLVEAIQQLSGLSQQVDCAVCYTNSIRINGMEGPYTSVLIDGQPIMSALASVYGLNGINPALIERIEIIKGPNSTLYGSDAMAGVINVITKDPRFAPRWALDARRTSYGMSNVDVAVAPSAGKVQALFSGSYQRLGRFLDANGDGFSDLTMDDRLALFGKVHLNAERGEGLSLLAKLYREDRFGGQRGWTKALRGSDEVYGESILTDRLEVLGRWGLPFESERVVAEFSVTHHDQDAMYATTPYQARQQVVAGQVMWDRTFGPRHDVLMGIEGRYQRFDDESPATLEAIGHFVPGVFAQDEISIRDDVKLLGGVRLDHHDRHGVIFSPRVALKLELLPANTIRVNAGTGFRVVDLFTEDYAALTHTRRLVTAADLDPERSYNVTVNVNQVLDWGNNPMMVDVDGFFTYFTNRIIPDYDSDPQRIVYHNLDGFGVTRGIGISLNQNLTVLPLFYTLGLTVQDVFYEHEGRREKELFASDYKGVWSLTWRLDRLGVEVDYAGSVVGPMRLPHYEAPFTRPTRSGAYSLHNVMATWKPRPGVEIYGGVKNLFDFAQPSPIVDPANPFGDNFDTSWVYGPVFGRGFVLGARYLVAR
jgi:outer membrane receptor for ferrienterochelin and colicins